MLHTLTNIESIGILERVFEVDQEHRDDISLFAEDPQWDEGSGYPFPGTSSPKKRTRVESEPMPSNSEMGRNVKRKSFVNLGSLHEAVESDIKNELEGIKVI